MNRRLIRSLAGVALLATLAACGGGSSDNSLTTVSSDTLVTTQVAGYPHSVNIYVPVGATRAIVVLHGGGGTNTGISQQLDMTTSSVASTATVNWSWLEANKVILVFPQGQHIDGATAGTWSNWAMDSGQDDVGFLKALSSQLRSTYGITNIALMGHSMGGAMTNRMWCEQPDTFNAYIALAGPASEHFDQSGSFACKPSTVQPYLSISGDDDPVMQTANGHWSDYHWIIDPLVEWAGNKAFLDGTMLGEWPQQQVRVRQRCGESLTTAQPVAQVAGNVTTWSSCSGSMVIKKISGAVHNVAGQSNSISDQMASSNPTVVMDAVMDFLNAQ